MPVLNPDVRERLWPYMGGIAKQNGIVPKCVGGVADHVHLLLALPTTMAIAKAIQFIKAGSSAWVRQTFPALQNFAWQQGYGAFSIGISQVEETIHYIEQQLEHHRTRTFKEEYLDFLKKHGGDIDERYLLGLAAPSYRTLTGRRAYGTFSRHFVPGYLQRVPTGQTAKRRGEPPNQQPTATPYFSNIS